MPRKFKVGDHVTWNSEAGQVSALLLSDGLKRGGGNRTAQAGTTQVRKVEAMGSFGSRTSRNFLPPTALPSLGTGAHPGLRRAFVSHHFKLDDMLAAYDTFGRAAETKALKVIIER